MTWVGGFGRPRTIVVALLLAALSGCDDSHQPELPERYARRFLPFTPRWLPEAKIPKQPQKSPGMVIWEVSETLAEPGPEEEKAANEWIERCYESARRHGWYEFANGLADGYERPPNDRFHYRNTQYMLDDRLLDPDHPEFLMYYPIPGGGKALVGLMFITKALYDRGPQFAGRLTVWHYHTWANPRCVLHDFISLGFARPGEECKKGEGRDRSPEMIHTWLIDHTKGPFATSMVLPLEVVAVGLEKRKRERGF